MTDKDGVEVDLPETKVNAKDFSGLGWVMPAWGIRCVISPGGSVKEDIRTAVQLQSNPKVTTVYKHVGWTQTEKGPTYIHAGGGITAKGNDPSIRVQLPQELSRYDLSNSSDPKAAVSASLNLGRLGPADVTWPLLIATYTPVLGPVDFAIHVTGRTGTFKSEVASLFQSHYGAGMDARHLPGSWSSTANALEAQAFIVKNAPFVLDDFVPAGTSWQVRAYQQTADKIIRAQGNQAGRARLTDTSNLQSTMYPRGIIISTGEDTPEGHSVRARMMIAELSPGDIDAKKLTVAQQNRPLYSAAVASFIQWQAANQANPTGEAESIRTRVLDIGHSRTPSMVGRLLATINIMSEWLRSAGLLDDKKVIAFQKEAEAGVMKAAHGQQQYLESADPVDMFTSGLRQIFGVGLGHVRTLNGGIPRNATMLGWVKENDDTEVPTFKSRGPCIGWVNWQAGELYLDLNVGYALVKKVAGNELTLTKQTLQKRLKDAGLITRSDEARQRNTVRVTAENHPRQVLCLALGKVLESQEVPADE